MIRSGVRRLLHLALRRRDHWEREVEEEIKLHLALRVEQLIEQGYTVDGAYAEATRRFGPLTESRARLLEAARHRENRMQRTEYLSDLRSDLTFALRTLRRDKGWTAVTVFTLALGIGAATAVFSAVSSLLLHPVGYPGADRIVLVYQQPAKGNTTGINVTIAPSAPVIRAWREGAHSLDAVEAYALTQPQMRTSGDPIELHGARIEPSFPSFAGVRPLVGRTFTPAEIAAGGRQVVLSEGLWRTRFGADSAVLGRSVFLDDSAYTIVGVLPAGLRVPRAGAPAVDVWLPLDLRDDRVGASTVVRVGRNVSMARAQADLDSVYARLSKARGDKANLQTAVASPGSQVNFRDSLMLLGYAVALVLLVACGNVAHLLLARSSSRRRELAIRVALGAGRSRVFRQLLTESLVLAVTGGALGVGGGWLGLRAIVAARPASLQALDTARVDSTTLVAALVVTILTSIAFGVLGAIQTARESTHESLKAGTQRSAASRGHLRRFLVVTEMALSATLVVGASMLIRSVINLQRADLGFDPSGLYIIQQNAARGHFAGLDARGAFLRTLTTRVGDVPGVQSVALTSAPPGWWAFTVGRLEIEGLPTPPATATEFIHANRVGRGYFGAMHQRIVAGSDFTDTTAAGHQVIVNERFARKQWRGESPIGKRLRVAQSGKEPWLTVVGVTAETGPVASDVTAPLLYTPAPDSDAVAAVVRVSGSADALASVRSLARAIDAGVPVKVRSVAADVADSLAEPRFVMKLLMLFTALGLALASIGLYGVMAYSVSQRTREIGIRMALGAPRGRIARGVIVGGIVLTVVGSVVGLALAGWSTRVLQSQLYGVARTDTLSFAAAAVVLIAAALLACVVPTRRALAVDPMTAIRTD